VAREEFQRELDALQDEVLRLGEVIVTRLRKAVTALEDHDVSLAERIADADHEINQLYLDLESDCIELFALHQPVASDLRFVAASFKILTDLERIGDLAANLAMYALDAHQHLIPEVDVTALADTAIAMVEDAMAAYADHDTEGCFAVADRDDAFDADCQRATQNVIRGLVDRSPTPDGLEPLLGEVTRVLLTVRDLERVGDHAVNIAARTLYMVESDDALIY
jgi:phosphate transport system protein